MSGQHNLKRRNFLSIGSALALTSLSTPASVAYDSSTAEQPERCQSKLSQTEHLCLNDFGIDDFRACIGTEFLVGNGLRKSSLRLEDVASHRRENDPRPSHLRVEPFSLQFASFKPISLAPAIQTLQHRRLGEMKVFISPIGKRENGTQFFEVVFG
ncbi:DUF6916 family protein [Undibacterium fentianense]|uniref:DUF6916 domain-containing protein n=1 Tax=Undibacterium fentianense TaxID=2828728 RepID=A0A941IGY0_9BURK|nr:hypothetical protein [Undibacterium fentianense]MBR7801812.1 hypothetical protein [Undibacterium fentianense]